MPAAAMQPTEEAVTAPNGKMSTLLRTHVKLRGQYNECRKRHNALIDRINELNQKN